jgi:hypothetical protein
MRISKVVLVLTVVLIGSAAWMYAQQRRPSDMLSPQDFLEIEQLVQGYTHGIDLGPEDASWVFASDAVFQYGSRTVSGEKELKEFYAGLRKNHQPTQHHLLSNLVLRRTAEGATGSVYLTTLDGSDTARLSFYGMYEDTFVKTGAGWRIKRRVYRQAVPPQLGASR